MTGVPSGRPSEPRTPPGSPAPAHGDGPTRPSTPTGHTEPRGCPFGFRHYNCDCKPLEATTPEPADRPPLRDQIIERAAEWAYAYPISSNAICQTDDRAWRLARIWGEQIARIAVMPVVEAETAALRQRAEEAERERDDYHQRFTNQMSAATDLIRKLERAERQHAEALDQIADERRGKLAAEAAVRRALAVLEQRIGLILGDVGPELRRALTIEQPKETP